MDLISLQDRGCCEGRGMQWVVRGGAYPPLENSLPLFDLRSPWRTCLLIKKILADVFISNNLGFQSIQLLGWKNF
jgi:hypothetical protein